VKCLICGGEFTEAELKGIAESLELIELGGGVSHKDCLDKRDGIAPDTQLSER
jgi:hypothetical protein